MNALREIPSPVATPITSELPGIPDRPVRSGLDHERMAIPDLRVRLPQLVRYGSVSLISTGVSLTILALLVGTNTMAAGWANVVATAVGTVPSFELNRRWVWAKRGRRSSLREIGPFCALSLAGLGLSTMSVTVVASMVAHTSMSSGSRALAASAANVGAFGVLWVLQFVILDRVLFGRSSAAVVAEALPDGAGQLRLDEGVR